MCRSRSRLQGTSYIRFLGGVGGGGFLLSFKRFPGVSTLLRIYNRSTSNLSRQQSLRLSGKTVQAAVCVGHVERTAESQVDEIRLTVFSSLDLRRRAKCLIFISKAIFERWRRTSCLPIKDIANDSANSSTKRGESRPERRWKLPMAATSAWPSVAQQLVESCQRTPHPTPQVS